MRMSNLDRRGTYGQGARGLSPNSFGQRPNPNVSVHSQHLWNMMEDIQLFPDEIYQLLKYEERNLSSYKKSIEREKYRVSQIFDSLKKQIEHNIEDLKISVQAELDRIYRNYMQKYGNLKGQIMEIKRLKDEIQLHIQSKSININTKFPQNGEKDKFAISNNASIIKSMEKNTLDVKRYQMSNYISELQRQKITPLSDLGREIVILTQYQNGYYQNKEFQIIANNLVDNLKGNLREIYDRKYQFIRQPGQICMKQSKPILQQLSNELPTQKVQAHSLQPQPPTFSNTNFSSMAVPVSSNMYQQQQIRRTPQASRLEQTKFIGIAPEQQNITYEFAQNVAFAPSQTIKNAAGDIILCALEVSRNTMAVGSKDGLITIYDMTSGQKITNLRGHKASICKLALVSHNGRKYLASGSDHGCSSIILWDLNSWNIKMKMQYHKAAVTAIVDLQDNRSLISGSYDKTINVYNLNEDGKMVFNLPANRASVTSVLMNCNGSKLITCGLDDTVSVHQIMRGSNRQVETMFLEREIQNNTMICSIVTSVLNPDLVFLGTKDGKIKLINIDRGQAYKIYNICSNAVIQLVVIERQTKPEFPIAVCWSCGQQNIKIVNTESGKLSSQIVKGFIEFGCGIGPKSFFMSNGRNLAMLSQSRERQEVNLFKIEVIN